MTLFNPWVAPILDSDPERAIRQLQESLSGLEHLVNQMRRSVEFGPVHGGYFPVELTYSNASGITAAVVDLTPISFEARPIAAYVTVFGSGATVTVQLNNSATPILASNLSVSDGSPVTLNSRGDFAVDKVDAPDLNLEVVSVDAGTPIHLRAMVVLKNVQKVEPA